MTEFIRALAKYLLAIARAHPDAQNFVARRVLRELADAVASEPERFVPALELALKECNLKLESKNA